MPCCISRPWPRHLAQVWRRSSRHRHSLSHSLALTIRYRAPLFNPPFQVWTKSAARSQALRLVGSACAMRDRCSKCRRSRVTGACMCACCTLHSLEGLPATCYVHTCITDHRSPIDTCMVPFENLILGTWFLSPRAPPCANFLLSRFLCHQELTNILLAPLQQQHREHNMEKFEGGPERLLGPAESWNLCQDRIYFAVRTFSQDPLVFSSTQKNSHGNLPGGGGFVGLLQPQGFAGSRTLGRKDYLCRGRFWTFPASLSRRQDNRDRPYLQPLEREPSLCGMSTVPPFFAYFLPVGVFTELNGTSVVAKNQSLGVAK